MRAYLVGVLGLCTALMAFGLSQARPSLNLAHTFNIAPSFVDKPSVNGEPLLPKRKLKASLLSRNALRVNHNHNGTKVDDADEVPPTYGLVTSLEIAQRFFAQAVISSRYYFSPYSRHRGSGGEESNLIYRFMHAK